MKVDNKFFSLIFNKFDFPVRFIYSRFWPINIFLHKVMFWKLYSSDFNKLDQKFSEMNQFLQNNNVNLKDKIVLELGPGNSFINAYNFLILGAKKVILVDKFSRYIKTRKQNDFYNKEIQFIKNKYKQEKLFFLDENNNVRSEFIQFFDKDITELDSLKVDFIYSVSVLEHIKEIKKNIIKMSKILELGGYMYHSIDMRDHYNFNNPFLFYKYSDYIWNNFLTKESLSYTNRWRYDDFIRCFNENNFKIVKEEKIEYKLDNIKINTRFKNYKNLGVGNLNIILQKEK